jgi:hypothetical protein
MHTSAKVGWHWVPDINMLILDSEFLAENG